MQNIELISIYHKDFLKSKETFNLFCKINNISLIQQELDIPVSISTYIPIMLGTLYSSIYQSNADWLLVLGPYTAINNVNFDISTILECEEDIILSAPFKDSRYVNFSFFAIRNTKKNKDLLRSLIAINSDIPSFEDCAAENSIGLEAFSKKFLNAISSFSVKYKIYTIFDKFYCDNMVNKTNDFFLASYLNDDLSYESKYVNLEENVEIFVKNVELEKHYSDDICIVSLFTDNIKTQGLLSAESISNYCNKHQISYKIYAGPIVKNQPGNWSKPFALNEMIKKYNTVVWIDSDIVFTNMSKSIRDIVSVFDQSFLACKDPSNHHFFNSGFMIFKKSNFTLKLLNHVCSDIVITGDKSSIYSNGGDQAMFIKRCKELGSDKRDYIILPEAFFNSHPVNWKKGDLVMHLMGYGKEYREKFMRYLISKFE
jgi:hypothetical protein